MTRGRHTELQLYWEMLERQFGPAFPLQLLSDDELAILDDLIRYAIDEDDLLPEANKLELFPMLGAVSEQRCLRSRYAWLASARKDGVTGQAQAKRSTGNL